MEPDSMTSQQPSTRLCFDYPVKKNGKTEFEEIPLVIAIMANLSGRPSSNRTLRNFRFADVRPGHLDELLTGIQPSLSITIPGSPDSPLTLQFRSLEDFEPHKIAQHSEHFRNLLSADPTLNSSVNGQPREKAATAEQSDEAAAIRTIHDEISNYLDSVLHDATFQSLHAAWLGVAKVLQACTAVPSARVAILDIRKEELTLSDRTLPLEALRCALEPHSNQLFGGHPPAALIADFGFSHGDADVLSALAELAESIGTVFIGGASAKFLPQDSFELITKQIKIFHHDRDDFKKWRDFRSGPTATNCYLTIPPILLRRPYERFSLGLSAGSTGDPSLWNYNERSDPATRTDYLWGNSVYALACIIIRSFEQYGWVAALSPLDGSGLTVEYSVYKCSGNAPPSVGPTFMPVIPRAREILSDLGFLPVVDCMGTPNVAVFEDHACCNSREGESYLLYRLLLYRLKHSLELFARHFAERATTNFEHEVMRILNKYRGPAELSSGRPPILRPVRNYSVQTYRDGDKDGFDVEVTLSYGGGREAPATIYISRASRPTGAAAERRGGTRQPLDGAFSTEVKVGFRNSPERPMGNSRDRSDSRQALEGVFSADVSSDS